MEIAGFVLVGRQIGVLATVGLVVAMSILGMILLRIQGLGAMARINRAMERGEAPGRELVHGLMIMIAALLLLIPGFVTDIVGLLLFIPPVRDLAWRLIKDRIVIIGGAGMNTPRRRRGDERTIDLGDDEFSRDPDSQEPRGSRPSIRDDR